MKSLQVSKWTKKVLAGMVPVAFLLVTVFSGNVSHAAAPTRVKALSAANNTGFTEITTGQSRDYATGGNHQDSKGTAGAGKGTISYSTDSGIGVLTLDSLDLTITTGLIQADGGNGELEIVLKGTNVITEKGNSVQTFLAEANLKFSGDGSLTINEESNSGGAILMEGKSNLEFAGDSVITINQSSDNEAINLTDGNLIMTKGTVNINQTGKEDAVSVMGNVEVNGGSLNIVQNAAEAPDEHRAAYGLVSLGSYINIAGGNVNVTLTNADTEGVPIYSNKGAVTISNANVKAIGGANKKSVHGIETGEGEKFTINKGSTVEMFGKEAANFEQVAIDDTVNWEVTAGDTAEAATKLKETKAADVLAKLKANKYSYVKLASIDKQPKTGNTGAIMPYILLLVAGVFTAIIANKKKAF